MKSEKILISRSWSNKSASIKVDLCTNKIIVQGLSYNTLGHWTLGPKTNNLTTIPEEILQEAKNKCMTPRLKNFYRQIWDDAAAQNSWFDY